MSAALTRAEHDCVSAEPSDLDAARIGRELIQELQAALLSDSPSMQALDESTVAAETKNELPRGLM